MKGTTVRPTIIRLLRVLILGGLLVTMVASLCTEAYAAPSVRFGSSCNDPTAKHVSMYYVNGVATNLTSAVENYTALGLFILNSQSFLRTLTAEKMCLHLGYKYNPTAGAILDFIESGQQLDKLLTPDFLRQWFVLGAVAVSSANPAVIALMTYIGSKAGNSDLINQADIAAHAAAYEADLKACRNVLLVPHSQGNLYAHQEHDLLYNSLKGQTPPLQERLVEGMRIVGVGSPDAEESVNSGTTLYSRRYKYRTNKSDLVMGGVTLYLASKRLTRLPSNTDWSGGELSAWFGNTVGHAFTGYLAINVSKTDILNDLTEQLAALPKGGCPQFSQETYTASTGAKTAEIMIVRSSAVNSETVTFLTPTGGTAVSGQDYLPTVEPVTFAVGETTKMATVSILNNTQRTSKRTLNLELHSGEGNTPLGREVTAVLEIPESGLSCFDGTPNITATAETYVDLFGLPTSTTTKTQPGPISVSISDGTASASASGIKGDVSLSASSQAGPANMGVARIEYDETFLITSEGKTGTGQATIRWQVSPSATDGGQINGGITKGGVSAGYSYSNFNGIPSLGEPSLDITFTYGIPDGFNFVLIAAAPNLKDPPRSSSASVRGGYSITVPGDPSAKITWCRATQ